MEELKEGYEEEVAVVEWAKGLPRVLRNNTSFPVVLPVTSDTKSPSYQSFSEEAESMGNSTPFSSLFGDKDSMRNLSCTPPSDKSSSNQFNPSNLSFYCIEKSNDLEVHV